MPLYVSAIGITDTALSELNQDLKLSMDKIRTLGLSKKQDRTVSCSLARSECQWVVLKYHIKALHLSPRT